MRSISTALAALDAAVATLREFDLDTLAPAERFTVLEQLETSQRQQTALAHDMIARLEQFEGCPPVPILLADVLRISRTEARRRVRDAEQLAPRFTLTGEPLPPELPATSQAWHDGALDGEHLRVIQKFLRDLPHHVPPLEVEKGERALAHHAQELRPDQLQRVADRLVLTLNPDGKFSDEDRARQRGFVWCGGQRADGMSIGKLIANPQLRAEIDSWLAKFAAPGMCNPDDQTPVTTGEPSDDAVQRDLRSHAQRQHDALSALVRSKLGDPQLGTHRGLPVTIIVSTTLQQLQDKSGHAITAGGTLLPTTDVIRLASHAYHYLTVFDGITGRPLYLGRTKRIATADQRIVLHAKERGCSRPGCDAPGYLTEVHHTDEWANGGPTNIDKLTFACGPDHELVTTGGWKVRMQSDGTAQWIPPPQLPLSPGTNNFHHPERLLPREEP